MYAQLREELNFLREIYLAGGGINVLSLQTKFTAAEKIQNPQLANVKGFYLVLSNVYTLQT